MIIAKCKQPTLGKKLVNFYVIVIKMVYYFGSILCKFTICVDKYLYGNQRQNKNFHQTETFLGSANQIVFKQRFNRVIFSRNSDLVLKTLVLLSSCETKDI